MIVQTSARPIARIWVGAVVVGGVAAGGSGGQVRMRAGTGDADIVGACVGVVRAGRPINLKIVQAGARSVAGIRVGAVVIRGITTGGSRRQIRMRAGTGGADVVGTFVAVVRAGGSVRLVIVQAGAGAITGIRVGAVVVGGIPTGGSGRQVRR